MDPGGFEERPPGPKALGRPWRPYDTKRAPPRRALPDAETAQAVALTTLAYVLADSGRAARFCAATGLGGGELAAHVHDAAFLGGVLDFVLDDEALLVEIAAAAQLPPDAIFAARQRLPGAPAHE